MSEKKVGTKGFLVGVLVGGTAGALTALLLSPKSGKEIRSGINLQSQTLKKKSNDLAQLALEKSTSIAKSVTDQSSNVVTKMKDWQCSFKKDKKGVDVSPKQSKEHSFPKDYDENK
ncbi:gas vesicle protein [Scopulibacillus daqui]|uniref:Gas vesicle protein n=1 Tax=Scopulibacillus daqui TaxID=1469162 RepID=A0ABS2PXT9_9BACL|nr:YtxH domain-containing protein [Scopulibacillus daqui]MBM7644859.1 gas vesicle protein [Scopulibacillus daqui]